MRAASASRSQPPARSLVRSFWTLLTVGNSLFRPSGFGEDNHWSTGRNADVACKRIGLFRGDRDGRNVHGRHCQPQRCAICGEPSMSAASDIGKAGRPLEPTPAAARKIPRAPDEADVAFRERRWGSPGPEDTPLPPNLRNVCFWIGLVCAFKVEPLCSANFLCSGVFLSRRCQCECPSCAEMARAALFVARA